MRAGAAVLDWLLLPAILVAIAWEPNFAHGYINYNESGQHLATIGELMRGSMLFRDIFVQYGPLHHYVPYWLFLVFGASPATLQGYFLVGEILGLLAAYALCRVVIPSRLFAYLAAIVIVMESHHPFWSTRWGGVRFGFVYLTLIGLLLHHRSGRRGWMLLAGASAGVAFLHTYDAGLAALLACAAYLAYRGALAAGLGRKTGAAEGIASSAALLVAGGLIAVLPFAAHLVFTGTFGDFLWQLPLLSPGRAWVQPIYVADLRPEILAPLAIYLVIGCGLLWSALRRRLDGPHVLPFLLLLASGGVLYALAFRAIRGSQYETSLPLAILATFLLVSLAFDFYERNAETPGRKLRAWAAFAAVVLVLMAFMSGRIRAYGGGPLSFARYQLLKSSLSPRHVGAGVLDAHYRTIDVERAGSTRVPDFQAEEIEAVTRFVRSHLGPDDPLFAYPDLGIFNYFSDRPHLTRFLIPILAAPSVEWSQEVLSALERARPERVLVGSELSTLARATRHGEEYLPDVAAYLEREYELEETFGRVQVYRLRDRGHAN